MNDKHFKAKVLTKTRMYAVKAGAKYPSENGKLPRNDGKIGAGSGD